MWGPPWWLGQGQFSLGYFLVGQTSPLKLLWQCYKQRTFLFLSELATPNLNWLSKIAVASNLRITLQKALAADWKFISINLNLAFVWKPNPPTRCSRIRVSNPTGFKLRLILFNIWFDIRLFSRNSSAHANKGFWCSGNDFDGVMISNVQIPNGSWFERLWRALLHHEAWQL